MSQSGKPIDDHSHTRLVESLSDQLRDSLSSLEANKPDFRELDLGSPVSPLRTRGLATATSSSSSSSGSMSGTRNVQNLVAKSNHSGELCTSSSNTSPTSTSTGLKTPSKTTSQVRSDPLIYSGSGHSSVNSPPPSVLPTGNICPSGKIMKTGLTMTTRSPKSDVLGSGTGNYGHGSIMRGGGGGVLKCDNNLTSNINGSHCSSTGIVDPEEVKRAANDMYKKGNFSEALALYEKAIALSPANAAYRSNRAAALMSLGRVAEAVRDCEEAVRLDPNYSRAHQRLASLLIRLGQVDSARKHLCLPGQPQDPSELSKLQAVEKHINRCSEARKGSDWSGALRESDAAIVAGADCCHPLFICKAEAHLKLHNLDDAESCLLNGLRVEYYGSSSSPQSRFFGMLCEAYSFLVKAQIEMALGRFDTAVTAAERAAQIDPRNVDVVILLKNVRLVSRSRARGNDLFKSERYTEACAAYGEGLKVDPSNSVLYCNRAACWYKLGLWERSVEDCNQALCIQPNYMKALLRRAASNSKLERWGDAVRDYGVLRRELPNDSEVAESLFHAQVALKKSRGEEVYNMKFGGEVEEVSGLEQFRAAVSLPGVCIVHFLSPCNMQCKQMCPFVDALCSRYPSINFFKVRQ
ncbi:TPR repeat-containing thioredoxin TTL1 [Linum perenne]